MLLSSLQLTSSTFSILQFHIQSFVKLQLPSLFQHHQIAVQYHNNSLLALQLDAMTGMLNIFLNMKINNYRINIELFTIVNKYID